jgi:hypothetical protein
MKRESPGWSLQVTKEAMMSLDLTVLLTLHLRSEEVPGYGKDGF